MERAVRCIATLMIGCAAPAAAAAEAPALRTVVTLGFDDGRTTQLEALPLLAEFGMRASFYVNSGNVGTTGYLDRVRLAEIQAAGHELGGHTLDHEVLTALPPAEAQRQVCDDRAALAAAGLAPLVSFAYPGGATDPEREAIVAGCGYRLAWAQGGIDKGDCTEDCTFAEPAAPPDRLRLRSPLSVTGDWTLADLQGFVLRAETQGGWIGLSFHHVCDDCGYRYRVSPGLLREFLAWLAPRAAHGTVVLPLAEAFDPPPPAPEPPPPGPTEPGPAAPAPAEPPPAPEVPAPSAEGSGATAGCSSASADGQAALPLVLAALWLTRRRLGPRNHGVIKLPAWPASTTPP